MGVGVHLVGRWPVEAAVAEHADAATPLPLHDDDIMQASLVGSPAAAAPAAAAPAAPSRKAGQGFFVNAPMKHAGIDADDDDGEQEEPIPSDSSTVSPGRGVRSRLNCGFQDDVGAVVMDSTVGGLTWIASQK